MYHNNISGMIPQVGLGETRELLPCWYSKRFGKTKMINMKYSPFGSMVDQLEGNECNDF